MEDIKIGRRTVASTVSRLIANNNGLHVPANGRRTALLLSSHDCSLTQVVRELQAAVITQQVLNDFGFTSFSNVRPFFFMHISEYGTAVQTAYTMYNQSGGDKVLQFTEFILLE